MSFNEAIDRYEDGKGATFLSFARLVITSRIRDHARRTSLKHEHVLLDAMKEESLEVQGSNSQPEQSEVAMYIKYKLPIARVVVRFKTTKRIVTRSRRFIIATVVILTKNLDLLRQWIYKGRKGCSSC